MLVIVIESYLIDYEHDYEHAMSAPHFSDEPALIFPAL